MLIELTIGLPGTHSVSYTHLDVYKRQILNFQIDQRNPDAETLVPAAATSQIG